MPKDYDDFQVGDVVWCLVNGKGEVVQILSFNSEDTHPILVNFGDVDFWYTKDGKLDVDANRTLFFSEPKVEGAIRRPFVPTLIGKRVVLHVRGGAPDPYAVVVTVANEIEDRFYINPEGSYYLKKDVVDVYEVSSESLLKK